MKSKHIQSNFVSACLTIFIVVISLAVQTGSQNMTQPVTISPASSDAPSTPLETQPITPFPTPAPTTIPTTIGADLQPSTTDDDSPIETCCYVQSACHKCKNLYKVNSITYCCPNCQGLVLVTDLRCRCYSQGLTNATLNCTKSKEVVGGYLPLRPSYYAAGASAIKASAIFSFGMIVIVTVWKDKRTV